MSLFEDTNPRELKELLSLIHNRDAGLPDFQRDFVWDPNATQELIVSIASNYPAGSLLRIRNTQNLFACREFAGAPELGKHRPTYLILDGQQRLTSLYQAFYGVGEQQYFLDLAKLLSGASFEECLFHARSTSKRAKNLSTLDNQASERTLPLSILKGGSGGFGAWSRKVARKEKKESARLELEDRLDDLEQRWIRTIDDYRFPVVTLSDSTDAAAVCTIFETLNRTGVKLSAFELLTARYWPKSVNLRALWSEALEAHPIIEDFEVDPYAMLQAIALVGGTTTSCSRGDILDMGSGVIEKWWSKTATGMAKGLEILRDDCGVLLPKWLPYVTLFVPLASTLAHLDLKGKPAEGAAREKLAQWFWCAVFGQAYEKAANSQAARDYRELTSWIKGGKSPVCVREFRFDPRLLRDVTPKQRSLYCGVICLILRHGPRDFHKLAKVTGDLMVDQRVDDHHVFPAGYLKDLSNPPSERLRNCVLNRTLIDRQANIRIGKRAPSDYLGEMIEELSEQKVGVLLSSHLLPSGKGSPLLSDNFEKFLAARQALLWAQIQEVTGAEEAADLLDDP